MADIDIYLLKNTNENKYKIKKFLFEIDNIFEVALSENINIEEYVNRVVDNGVVHVATIDSKIIGAIIGYANNFEEKKAHISILGLLDNYRGHGIGTRLLKSMIDTSKNAGMESIDLFTHSENTGAILFYEKIGFTKTQSTTLRNNEYHLNLNLSNDTNKDDDKKESILITAIGSFAADITIKSYKDLGYRVVGTDIYERDWLANSLEVDEFYEVPKVLENEKGYINSLMEISLKNKIKFIIPLTDFEVDVLSAYKEEFSNHQIIICTPDKSIVDLCRDKYKLPKYLEERNIDITIPTLFLEDDTNYEYPVFVKPRFGRSSVDTKLIYKEQKLKELIKEDAGYLIVQPYVKGPVITVDVLRTNDNEIISLARREILRNPSGAGTTVEIIKSDYIEEMCKQIAEIVKFVGVVNIEFIEKSDGKYSLLEINPRFSGGIAFSNLAGYNFPKNHLSCFLNTCVDRLEKVREITVARKYEEVITK